MIKILIVDDVNTNVQLLKILIQDYFEDKNIEEYSIDIAVNGWEAVGMAVLNKYDVMFLDILMPKYDGYEVLHAIRIVKKNEHQPYICMVTGVSDQEQIELFQQKGANSYVTKPYHNSKIIQILDASLLNFYKKEEDTQLELFDTTSDLINFDFVDFYDETL